MDTARAALVQLRATRQLNTLIDAYLGENDAARRWLLLDTVLDCSDPGEAGNELPLWVNRLSKGMSYLTWIYVRERLSEGHKKKEEEARRVDFFKKGN